MTDTPEPCACSGCGARAGDRQVLKKKTDRRAAVFATVILRPVKIFNWERLLCRKYCAHAAKVIDHVSDLRLT